MCLVVGEVGIADLGSLGCMNWRWVEGRKERRKERMDGETHDGVRIVKLELGGVGWMARLVVLVIGSGDGGGEGRGWRGSEMMMIDIRLRPLYN